MSTPDYGQVMAEAAADGYDSPEAAATARRQAREAGRDSDYFPELEKTAQPEEASK